MATGLQKVILSESPKSFGDDCMVKYDLASSRGPCEFMLFRGALNRATMEGFSIQHI